MKVFESLERLRRAQLLCKLVNWAGELTFIKETRLKILKVIKIRQIEVKNAVVSQLAQINVKLHDILWILVGLD